MKKRTRRQPTEEELRKVEKIREAQAIAAKALEPIVGEHKVLKDGKIIFGEPENEDSNQKAIAEIFGISGGRISQIFQIPHFETTLTERTLDIFTKRAKALFEYKKKLELKNNKIKDKEIAEIQKTLSSEQEKSKGYEEELRKLRSLTHQQTERFLKNSDKSKNLEEVIKRQKERITLQDSKYKEALSIQRRKERQIEMLKKKSVAFKNEIEKLNQKENNLLQEAENRIKEIEILLESKGNIEKALKNRSKEIKVLDKRLEEVKKSKLLEENHMLFNDIGACIGENKFLEGKLRKLESFKGLFILFQLNLLVYPWSWFSKRTRKLNEFEYNAIYEYPAIMGKYSKLAKNKEVLRYAIYPAYREFFPELEQARERLFFILKIFVTALGIAAIIILIYLIMTGKIDLKG
ncbi:MAG: hypothetical protein AAF731_06095 [Bacteroidota bacterium]